MEESQVWNTTAKSHPLLFRLHKQSFLKLTNHIHIHILDFLPTKSFIPSPRFLPIGLSVTVRKSRKERDIKVWCDDMQHLKHNLTLPGIFFMSWSVPLPIKTFYPFFAHPPSPLPSLPVSAAGALFMRAVCSNGKKGRSLWTWSWSWGDGKGGSKSLVNVCVVCVLGFTIVLNIFCAEWEGIVSAFLSGGACAWRERGRERERER